MSKKYIYQIHFGETNLKAVTMRFLGKNNIHRWVELLKVNTELKRTDKLLNGQPINIPSSWMEAYLN